LRRFFANSFEMSSLATDLGVDGVFGRGVDAVVSQCDTGLRERGEEVGG